MIYRYKSIAVGAKEASTYTTGLPSSLQTNSSASNLADNINPYNYESLEPNAYDVDNPRPLFNPIENELGFVRSDLSTSTGAFNVAITLNISLDSYFEFQGITINCDRSINYINIKTYNNDHIVLSKTFEGVCGNYFEMLCENVNLIIINIYGIEEANRFLNIYGVELGKIIDWTDENVSDVKMINQISVTGRELPIDTLSFSVVDIDRNTIKTETNQMLEVINESNAITNRFYLDDFKWSEDNTKADLSFNDIASCLDDDFMGGVYDNVTVSTIVESILYGTNIVCDYGNVDNYTKTDVTLVSGYIPKTTRRNALIYVANATGYKWLKHPNLKLIVMPSTVNHTFGDDSIFSGTIDQTTQQPARKVSLIKYSYTNVSKESKELYNDTVCVGIYTIEFSEPIASLSLEEEVIVEVQPAEEDEEVSYETQYVTTDKATIVESNANYCIINVVEDFKMMLTGKPYIINQNTLIKSVTNLNLYRNYKTESIDTFTLVNSGNLNRILTALYNYYAKTEIQKAKVLWDNPSIGECVCLNGLNGNVSKITTSFSDAVEIEVE